MLDFSYKTKIRLYFPGKISLKIPVKLENKQVHYLINVMRKKVDDSIIVFNSVDGEFLAKISKMLPRNSPLTLLKTKTDSSVFFLITLIK